MTIRAYEPADEDAVLALWERCGLTRPWNDARKDIARKLALGDDLFIVAQRRGRIVGTAMAGYEGHRGWINYLAVDSALRSQGVGGQLIVEVEARLMRRGCPKINVQIRADNSDAIAFYRKLGYSEDQVVSMGKRLEQDD